MARKNVFPVRLDDEEVDHLRQLATESKLSAADVIRQLIRTAKTKKANKRTPRQHATA